MVPIALCSVIVVAFFLERTLALRRGAVCPGTVDDAATEDVVDGEHARWQVWSA